jgi:hypothetical protein
MSDECVLLIAASAIDLPEAKRFRKLGVSEAPDMAVHLVAAPCVSNKQTPEPRLTNRVDACGRVYRCAS